MVDEKMLISSHLRNAEIGSLNWAKIADIIILLVVVKGVEKSSKDIELQLWDGFCVLLEQN